MSGRNLRTALLVILALFGLVFLALFIASLRRLARSGPAPITGRIWPPSFAEIATGAITVFFDTFGIGSFATTTAIVRAWRLVPDELIPGTLNVGHTLSSTVSAFVFIGLVPVGAGTLLSMIAAAGLGAWLGAGIVGRLPRYRVRIGMGGALLFASGIMLLTQLGILPGGGEELQLTGARLAVAVAANFVLGGLMTLGIGLYAPCMIIISLLGMNPRAAFPIMMGSCAFLLPISGARFAREGKYHPSASIGITLGGVPALLFAAYVIKSLPITAVRWLVIVVVLYTALTLLQAGRKELASRSPAS